MTHRILVVDDEVSIARSFGRFLSGHDFVVDTAGDLAGARKVIGAEVPDLVVCDVRLPDGSGLDLLDELKSDHPQVLFVVITAYATRDTALQALKSGAADLLTKPVRFEQLLRSVQGAMQSRPEAWRLQAQRRSASGSPDLPRLLGGSAPLTRLKNVVGRVAPSDATVLIRGESGTGKEIVARRLHALSSRARGPFVALNCSAIPETLLESELFGYRKGAFSGADADKAGLVEIASQGTLFLDEIGDLPITLQPKLLRLLEQGEVRPLGSTDSIQVAPRVVAATNQPLESMIADKTFREDLYFRLAVVRVDTPSLSECREDIPELVINIIRRSNESLGTEIASVRPETMARLQQLEWPGNVRELEHRVQRAMLMADRDVLGDDDFFDSRLGPGAGTETSLKTLVSRYETDLVRETVESCGGDKREAARRLDISLASLYAKLKRAETNGPGRLEAESGG